MADAFLIVNGCVYAEKPAIFLVLGKDGIDVSSLQEQREIFFEGIIKGDDSSGSVSFHCFRVQVKYHMAAIFFNLVDRDELGGRYGFLDTVQCAFCFFISFCGTAKGKVFVYLAWIDGIGDQLCHALSDMLVMLDGGIHIDLVADGNGKEAEDEEGSSEEEDDLGADGHFPAFIVFQSRYFLLAERLLLPYKE